jgi:hypothetical protein
MQGDAKGTPFSFLISLKLHQSGQEGDVGPPNAFESRVFDNQSVTSEFRPIPIATGKSLFEQNMAPP